MSAADIHFVCRMRSQNRQGRRREPFFKGFFDDPLKLFYTQFIPAFPLHPERDIRHEKAGNEGLLFDAVRVASFENAFEPLNNNTFSRDMLNYDFGPALNIHYGDILVKYGYVCDIQAEGLFCSDRI